MMSWLDGLRVIGEMSPAEAAVRLRAAGDEQGAQVAEADAAAPGAGETFGMLSGLRRRRAALTANAHVFGHVGLDGDGEAVPVRHAGDIDPDVSLRGARVRVSLGRLHVADYPGSGPHFVLFDFYGSNQLDSAAEDLRYNTVVRVSEGEHAAVVNRPIFVGLGVGAGGLALKCFTINVKNGRDQAMLAFLDSKPFQAGLRLVAAAQPAIALLVEVAEGLTRAVFSRNENVPVQRFEIGLDFDRKPFGLCLREGAYVAVQVPASELTFWAWDRWVYDRRVGEIVGREAGEHIPYNHVAFTISREAD
jgi:hypothetical protein